MKIDWDLEAIDELLNLEDEIQSEVIQGIEELPERGLDWELVERVKRRELGIDFFRLKLDPEEKTEINHRVLFDVWEGKFYILKIGSRENFYSRDELKEARSRTPK